MMRDDRDHLNERQRLASEAARARILDRHPEYARPVPEWVRRARLHELPASDRTAER